MFVVSGLKHCVGRSTVCIIEYLRVLCAILVKQIFDWVPDDAVLSSAWFRKLVLLLLRPGFPQLISRAIPQLVVRPAENEHSFGGLKYHISADARETLLQVCLHSFAQSTDAVSPYVARLPDVSRVLLQTSQESADKYLRTVALATAREVGATVVAVNQATLSRISKLVLGRYAAQTPSTDRRNGLGALLWSLFAAGGRVALAWDVLELIVRSVTGPVILYISDVDQLVSSTPERLQAFMDVFDVPTDGAGSGARRPLVVIGGLCVREVGTALLPSHSRSSGGDGAPGFLDGLTGGGLPTDDSALASLLGAADGLADVAGTSAGAAGRDGRELLQVLFPTRVVLHTPSETAAGLAHRQQLARDAREEVADANYRTAAQLAVSSRLILPSKDCALYEHKSLGKDDWGKVLAWAVALQMALDAKQPAPEQQDTWPQRGDSLPSSHMNGDALDRSSWGQAACAPEQLRQRPQQPHHSVSLPELRHATGGGGGGGGGERRNIGPQRESSHKRGRAVAAPPAAAHGLLGSLMQWALLEGKAVLGWATEPEAGASDTCSLATTCPAIPHPPKPSALVRAPSASSSAPDALAARIMSQLQHSEATSAATAPAPPAVPDLLYLSEDCLWHGLHMLEKGSGGLKGQIKVDNVYERRLLGDVVAPEEAGAGFCEVGAMSGAKTALREAVQLPLQHPELFTRSALISGCKGVLLFGPPGTGKTLIARAAAAECGASFLAVHPSSILSKWLGDGVRNVRAIFSLAAKLAPCVVFVDEVDALLGRRHESEHESMREIKNEFMGQWDGLRSKGAAACGGESLVVVLGATNRPQDLDEAVLRRFSRRIFCDLPNKEAREQILKVILATEAVASDVSTADIAAKTDGYSGSDLRQLCTTAAMRAVRELLLATGRGPRDAQDAAHRRPVTATPAPATTSIGPRKCLSAMEVAALERADPATATRDCAVVVAAGSGQQRQQQLQLRRGRGSTPDDDSAQISAATSPRSSSSSSSAAVHDSAATTVAAVAVDSGRHSAELARAGKVLAGPTGSLECSDTQLAVAPTEPGAVLQQLARQYRCSSAATKSKRAALRAINARDFKEALVAVAPSTDVNSDVMNELKTFNAKYGDNAPRRSPHSMMPYYI